MNEFSPYSKAHQLKGNKKQKDKPKFKERRYKKKPKRKKKVEMHKGRVIPHRKKRSSISEKEYIKALEKYNGSCAESGSNVIEMHHVIFRSQGGRGAFRNLVPLSLIFHKRCHNDREYADKWRIIHEQKYGPHFMKDKYDIWKEGYIENPTEELFEKFMKSEEERCENQTTNGLNGRGK